MSTTVVFVSDNDPDDHVVTIDLLYYIFKITIESLPLLFTVWFLN